MSSKGFGSSNGLSVDVDALIAVGAGKVPGVGSFAIQASVTPLDTNGQDLISWATEYVWPNDAGEVMTIKSDNAADVGLPVLVLGLDENFSSKVTVAILNGLTPVALPGLWSRINFMDVRGLIASVGNVDVEGDGNIYCRVAPEFQISNMGIYTSPAGSTVAILDVYASMVRSQGNSDDALEVDIYFKPTNDHFKLVFELGLQRRGSSSFQGNNTVPNARLGPVDFKVRVVASSSTVSAGVRMTMLQQEPNK